MKKFLPLLLAVLLLAALLLTGCTPTPPADEGLSIVATTYPVYMLTREMLRDTPHSVTLLVQDEISCLHDYTLTTTDMQTLETADVVVINGAGLESFMHDMLESGSFTVINASEKGFQLLEWGGHIHTHDGVDADISDADDHHDHDELLDPHVWTSLHNYVWMQQNIREALVALDPEREETYNENGGAIWDTVMNREWEMQTLRSERLFRREFITFHDGFQYFAQGYVLDLLKSIEEEAGSEASAKDIEEIIELINLYELDYIYTETLGATATADAIARETGVEVRTLDMGMSGELDAPFEDYVDRIYNNLIILLEDSYE